MCDRLDDSASPSRPVSQTGKIFSEIFEISVAQLSVRTAYEHRPDAHLSPQPINRGLCAWELQEFGIEFHYCLESYFVRLLSWFVLSEAVVVCTVAVLKLKSILGVGLKVKDSIEDPFR